MNLDQSLCLEYWHLACHRRELPKDGDFLKFKTPIGDVVIFNDEGEYIAFDNLCPHRGALIYPVDFGNQAATCKYHGWTFKSGSLIIPRVESYKDCDILKAKLNRYQLDWCGDFIFFAINPLQSLYDQLSEVAGYLENISFNIDAQLDINIYDYKCYWALAVENALEPDHISLIHSNTLANLKLDDGVNTFFGVNSVWKARVENKRINDQLQRLKPMFNLDYSYDGYTSIFMFPFTTISSTFGFSYSIQSYFPNASYTNKTYFMSRMLGCNTRNIKAKEIVKNLFNSSAKLNRAVFEEDHAICQALPADSWRADPLQFASESEIKISHFRDSCRQHVAA